MHANFFSSHISAQKKCQTLARERRRTGRGRAPGPAMRACGGLAEAVALLQGGSERPPTEGGAARAEEAGPEQADQSQAGVAAKRRRLCPAPAAAHPEAALEVAVRTLAGDHCEISAKRRWTCRDLKARIAEALRVPAQQQRLLHGTTLLECDASTLDALLPPAAEAEAKAPVDITLVIRGSYLSNTTRLTAGFLQTWRRMWQQLWCSLTRRTTHPTNEVVLDK